MRRSLLASFLWCLISISDPIHPKTVKSRLEHVDGVLGGLSQGIGAALGHGTWAGLGEAESLWVGLGIASGIVAHLSDVFAPWLWSWGSEGVSHSASGAFDFIADLSDVLAKGLSITLGLLGDLGLCDDVSNDSSCSW